jgi:hypothetical protein
MPEKAFEIREKYKVELPSYLSGDDQSIRDYLAIIGKIHQTSSQKLLSQWRTLAQDELKTDIAIRLIAYKAHGLAKEELKELSNFISSKIGPQETLQAFVNDPDLKNKEAINLFISWINSSDELTANPYLSPLVISAVEINSDTLTQYEILNASTEFNRDPILWLLKIRAARASGLDNYATESLEMLKQWVSTEEIQMLQTLNY